MLAIGIHNSCHIHVLGSFGSWNDCGILCQFTGYIVRELQPGGNAATEQDLLKVLTEPFTHLIIQVYSSSDRQC